MLNTLRGVEKKGLAGTHLCATVHRVETQHTRIARLANQHTTRKETVLSVYLRSIRPVRAGGLIFIEGSRDHRLNASL